MSRHSAILLASLLLCGCPPTLGSDDDDDDATANDDDATADDDDATANDDDATANDDDATANDDDATEQTFCVQGFTESDVLEAVYSGPKVPAGYFTDPNLNATWGTDCSGSLADSQANAAARYSQGTMTGNDATTTWFYEVEVQLGPNTLIAYRDTRCEAFDGTTLGGSAPFDFTRLQELVSYLWWTQNHNYGGANILGGVGNPGGATDFFQMCHVTTVYGDWGLQDEITVLESQYGISQFGGEVGLGAPVSQGVIGGNWN